MDEQTFTVHAVDAGYLIRNGTATNTLYVADEAALKRLIARLTAYVASGLDDGPAAEANLSSLYITSGEAMRYAAGQGYKVSNVTLNSACDRGTIVGAIKVRPDDRGTGSRANHSQWRIPRSAFLVWFEDWKAKAQKRTDKGGSV